jgi:hypothetical protein
LLRFHLHSTVKVEAVPTEEFSGAVERGLESLCLFLATVRGPVRSHIPPRPEEIPTLAKKVLDLLTNLTMLHQELLSRILSGQASLGTSELPIWAERLVFSSVQDSTGRVTATEATETLVAILEDLNDKLRCLDDQEISSLPTKSSDIPRFFGLISAAIDRLTWFLHLNLILRVWPNEELLVAEKESAD